MTSRRTRLLAPLAILLFATPILAADPPPGPGREPPPPALMVVSRGISKPLKLASVKTEVRIVGTLAETTTTLRFYNPNRQIMEGQLYVPLPEGVTISGYALDVGGVLRDGVVVAKQKARQVFEAEVRRGVDPGLVEWTRGNVFRTRVYPIPARGSRTVRLSYVSEIGGAEGAPTYHLPLAYRDPVGEFSLRVEVVKSATKPQRVRGGPKGLVFEKWRDSFVAEVSVKNRALVDDLFIELPATSQRAGRVEQSADGFRYFVLSDWVTAPVVAAPMAVTRVGLYWDASRSRENAPRKEELGVFLRWAAGLDHPIEVSAVIFRDVPEPPRRFALPQDAVALERALLDAPLDGGTQLGNLPPLNVDLNVLLSDGLGTYGAMAPKTLKAPTWCINGASVANHALLRDVAARSGGAYLNLGRVTARQAAAAIGRPVFGFLSAEVDGMDSEELYPHRPVAVDGAFFVAGRMKSDRARITVRYGVAGRVGLERRFEVDATAPIGGELLRRFWAQKQVDELLAFEKQNAAAIAAVGMTHGIVTPGTSLLVLESLAQYLRHQVRPPASQPKLRRAFDVEIQNRRAHGEAQRKAKLDVVLSLWEARVAWWEKRYTYPKGYRYHDRSAGKSAMAEQDSATSPEVAPTAAAPPPSESARVMAKGKKKSAGPRGGASIKLAPWNPDTPYLRAILATPKAKHYATYLAERAAYGGSPAFYLDCADLLLKDSSRGLALRVLSNLAEIELDSAPLLRVLAGRLVQLGELDLAIGLYDAARVLRPDEPQSYRDLALALARRAEQARGAAAKADFERALRRLAQVVMGQWQRFAEIEVIALTELNRLIPKARAAGLKTLPIDPRLVKHLDMDIRIVMTWDADSTDMDLHVVEPSGEEAYFSHNRTRIGGMVSRDFTQGYGPEVYALRRAMPGEYIIKTKFYGSSAAKLIGAVTLQLDIYTNYGRPHEKRQSITLRLTDKKETFEVGRIRFGGDK